MNWRLLCVAAWIAFAVAPPIAAQIPAPPKAPPTAPDTDNPATLADDKATVAAGEKWLALIDSGTAGQAWDLASPHLKASVTRAKFVSGMRDMRKPFGKLVSRTAAQFARAHSMPGAPDGDYAIVQYEVAFANGKKGSELLTWVLGSDEQWRVAGYYIR